MLKLLLILKFMFSKKATKIDEIFTVDLTRCSKCQIYGEDVVNFRGLLKKYELYLPAKFFKNCNVNHFQIECVRKNEY